MARKSTDDTPVEPETKAAPEVADSSAADATAADIQARFDEAHDKGYFGWSPDPIPNAEYSLATGPDAPSAADQLKAVQAKPKEG